MTLVVLAAGRWSSPSVQFRVRRRAACPTWEPIRAPRDRARAGAVSWRAVLAVVVVIPFAMPFVWLVASAFKPIDQFYAFPPTLLPDPPSLANLEAVLRLLESPRLFANSTFIAVR